MVIVIIAGAVTPPVGATAYVVAGMSKDVSLNEVFKGVIYFLPAYAICVLLLMLFPEIATFLPELIK
jgi:TRAP-type C4-dicarboxylate transport system permease large subunit